MHKCIYLHYLLQLSYSLIRTHWFDKVIFTHNINLISSSLPYTVIFVGHVDCDQCRRDVYRYDSSVITKGFISIHEVKTIIYGWLTVYLLSHLTYSLYLLTNWVSVMMVITYLAIYIDQMQYSGPIREYIDKWSSYSHLPQYRVGRSS